MKLLVALFLPLALYGQLTLTTGDCATGAPITSSFDFGTVAAGATQTVTFLVCNPGNTAVNVTTILVSGAGFVLSGAPTTYLDPPLSTLPLRLNVEFTAATPAAYSASLQVNSINVFLLATVVPANTLSVNPPCRLAGSQIDFGGVSFGKFGACTFTLQTASSIAVAGSGFQLTSGSGATQQFTIQLSPACGTMNYAGTLTIGIQTYALSATGFLPPLPTPILTFDSTAISSGQQHTLSMSLPSVYPCPASVFGYVNLAFTSTVSLVSDDPTIVFVSGSSRTLNLALGAAGTQFSIAGQANAAFNTGSTAGTITFSVSTNGLDITGGDPSVTFKILPATVSIDTATASNQILGQLDVTIIGFDNTYSAGGMSFSFFDSNGNTIGSPISADFTSSFKNFFAAQTAGSAFRALLSFLVTGNQTEVASVAVTLTNAAGQAQTGNLTFQ